MDPFVELGAIWETATGKKDVVVAGEVVDLLRRNDIGLRQDDGDLRQVTLSKPVSVSSGFVVGLRYIKRDGTLTEDLFTAVAEEHQIKSWYKGSLQGRWPKYQGTHKQPVNFTQLAAEPPFDPTLVNTLTFLVPAVTRFP